VRRISLYLLLIFVFTVPWQNAVAFGGSKTLSSLIGIAALLVALVTCVIEGKAVKPPAFVFAFGALIVWQLATYFWSLDPTSTLVRALTMAQLLAMVWLISELCVSERERLELLQAFVLGCVVVCLVLIQAYLSGQSLAGYRYAPPGFNQNESADIIATGIPMALLVATSHKRGFLRWLNIAYVPLGVFAVILTASRSGFIATCLGLVSVFFALSRVRPVYRLVWLVIILAVFASLFYGLPVGDNLETNIQRITFSADTGSLETFTGRTTIWSAGLGMFAEHPIVGIGSNTFILGLEARGGGYHAAHNIWVQTAAETGIIGLILLVASLATAVIPAVRWRDFRIGFHLTLFLVLMTTSLAANLVASKGFWIGLAILCVTGAIRGGRSAPEASRREVGEHISVMGTGYSKQALP
jgi:O-antigen ligase